MRSVVVWTILATLCLIVLDAPSFAADVQEGAMQEDDNTSQTTFVRGPDTAPYDEAMFRLLVCGPRTLSYHYLHTSGRDKLFELLRDAAHLRGDAIQLLRFFAWINDRDTEIRKELMRQWVGQMKRDPNCPTYEVICSHIKPLLRFANPDEVRLRIFEIEMAYKSPTDPSSYSKDDRKYLWGRNAYRDLGAFIDTKAPMRSILFSGSDAKILDAWKQSLIRRGRWDSNSSEARFGPTGIGVESCDLALDRIFPKKMAIPVKIE